MRGQITQIDWKKANQIQHLREGLAEKGKCLQGLMIMSLGSRSISAEGLTTMSGCILYLTTNLAFGATEAFCNVGNETL